MASMSVWRTGLTYASLFGATGTLAPIIGAVGFLGNPETSDRLIRWWSHSLMFSAGVRWEIFGREHAEGMGPCVIMSSHRSHLDGPLLLCALPIDFAFVIKQALAKIPLWGWAVTGAGYVSIDRSSKADSMEGMRKAAESVRHGRRVLTFPEGSRAPSDEFLPFKKGGAVLAIEAQVPVLPAAIAGTYDILPRDTFSVSPGRAVVCVGKPIPTERLTYEDRGTLLADVETEIHRLYAEAKGRLEKAGQK